MLVEGFDRLGLKYTLPQGSYFVLLVGRLFTGHNPESLTQSV